MCGGPRVRCNLEVGPVGRASSTYRALGAMPPRWLAWTVNCIVRGRCWMGGPKKVHLQVGTELPGVDLQVAFPSKGGDMIAAGMSSQGKGPLGQL
eukprot:613949-Prorocentrum_lima.AAC.1